MRRTAFPLLAGLALACSSAWGQAPEPLPRVADGWTIDLIARAPAILFPTAVVVAPDGTIYLGQDPMDMPGPPSKPIDSVVALKEGKVRTFADGLHAVMGLEWIEGTLYVVHAPFLSAFTDLDGDGRADRRVDLVTGLGPADPAFSGLNDHIASGLRLGMDGFLYIAVGDKGIPKGVGKDGTTIRMKGGGVIRVRPDGSDLEIVSTGERNPLSVALTDRDEVFTYGNDDDSHRWPNSLTHHVVGGHYGYPYEFLTAPWRCLPTVAGQMGGAGTQAIVYNEDALPPPYRGGLFACDWGLQAVFRYELKRSGATFKVARREPFVTKGDLADFRPFSIAADGNRPSLILVDWGYNGWLADGPKTGRLYRLTYHGAGPTDRAREVGRAHAPRNEIADLDSPSMSARREARRRLMARGEEVVPQIVGFLKQGAGETSGPGRDEAIWTLDAIGTPLARAAIRDRMPSLDARSRAQAARSVGLRRDESATAILAGYLGDADPIVRREAAIALGRIGSGASAPALYAALGDPDRVVAWSVRGAIRRLDRWNAAAIKAALRDPKRRDDALALADESWAPPAIEALLMAYGEESDPLVRSRILANLAGQYRKYPEWSGAWFGTNPLAGAFPAKTVDWDPRSMRTILVGLARGLVDPAEAVRRQAIVGLTSAGPEAAANFLAALPREADATNRAAMIAALGRWGEPRALPIFAQILRSADQPLALRVAALDALGGINSRQAFNLRFGVVFDPSAPPELVARALPALGRSGALPPNDLADFLEGKPRPIRVAALLALREVAKLPPDVQDRIIARLDDPDAEVRHAAIDAVARLRLAAAVPKLIALAKSEETRPDAAAALAVLPDPRALDVYLDAIRDRSPEVRRLAEAALVRIRPRVADELRRRAGAGEFTGPSSLAVDRVLAEFRPIVDWRAIGPFPRTTAQIFFGERSIDFARTHAGLGGRPVAWQPRQGEPKTGRVALDDLAAAPGGGPGFEAGHSPDLAAFAYAEIPSDRDGVALLLLGSTGPIVVSLNEAIVHNGGGPRPSTPDAEAVRVPLVKGINRVLVRSRQGIGAWAFSVQVSEPAAPALAAKPAPPGVEALRAFALGHSGDARKGEELFFDPRGLNCARCHSAGGRGTSTVGPDLTGLALKYDKAEVVRSVLEPSARIAAGYQPAVVARKDGRVVTGLVRGESASHVDLIDAEVKLARIPKSEIEARRVGDVSLMPPGLVDGLTPVDFADLVAYLMSLKSTARP